MGIVYRLKKGSPLSAKELDNNFHELEQRIETLEHSLVPSFQPRGQWKAKQSYARNDIITTGKQAYCCVAAHESSADFAADHEKWRILIDLSEQV